jgi:hypothetical protein
VERVSRVLEAWCKGWYRENIEWEFANGFVLSTA